MSWEIKSVLNIRANGVRFVLLLGVFSDFNLVHFLSKLSLLWYVDYYVHTSTKTVTVQN